MMKKSIAASPGLSGPPGLTKRTQYGAFLTEDPPPFEKLLGDLSGAYSRRINIRHRLVHQVLPEIKTVKVIRMWTHYE